MEEVDVDCVSCGYAIRDFSQASTVSCGHGVIHRNCSYFNNDCNICDKKLTADAEYIQFRPRDYHEDENMQFQLQAITSSLSDLRNLLLEQRLEQLKTSKLVAELTEQLIAKDAKITDLQKEVYEMKLEKVEAIKKELQEKLNSLT